MPAEKEHSLVCLIGVGVRGRIAVENRERKHSAEAALAADVVALCLGRPSKKDTNKTKHKTPGLARC